ncbi:MAG: 16S rRNA (adenine(1518)-N(6)/adenine(1519)-N(6))-dimethyltransferase RsmA [Hyphomicrobiaceae bacterium]
MSAGEPAASASTLVEVDRPEDLPPLRDVIAAIGLTARKSLGQNFLLDLNLTQRIARAGRSLTERAVVEVGPGPGGLTRALLMQGARRVIAVERDARCEPALRQIASAWPGRLDVVFDDATKIDWASLVRDVERPISIAANLPYGVATKLLTDWLETEPWPPWFDSMVLMFQREVADRILAAPGTKPYGRLSVIAQYRCAVRRALNLPPSAFVPAPKVESSVVVFEPLAAPMPTCRIATLSRMTAAAFGQRRKMLRVSLKQLTPFPELLLNRTGIAPERRAEELSVADFARLAAAYDCARDDRAVLPD